MMQSVTILCPSPLNKDKAIITLQNEYIKRISASITLQDLSIKTRDSDSPDIVKQKQGEALLSAMSRLPKDTAIIVLDENGKQPDSIAFSKDIEKMTVCGRSHFCFIIGGAYGLSQEVKELADIQLSLGRMVWPHKLVSVMLLEQIYRAQQILKGHPYHKA